MKFKIEPKDFKAALDFVASATNPKDSGITSNILVESLDKGTLQITGTDGLISVRRTFAAKVTEEGGVCVASKKLLTVVKNLTSELTFKVDEQGWVRIASGKSNHRIAAQGVDAFPTFPEADDYSIEITSESLGRLIKTTAFAVTSEETSYSLKGVKLEVKDGVAKMVATDGARVAYKEEEMDGTIDIFLPKNSLSYLSKLPKGDLEIGENENHIFFKLDNLLVAARKVIGTFPAYESVVQFPTDKSFTTDLEEFAASFRRVVGTADDKVNALRMDIRPNEVKLSTTTQDSESEDVVDVNYKGKETTINLNAAFLQDFFHVSSGKTLQFLFKDYRSPVKFNFGTDDYFYIVMPLAISQ